MHQVLHALHVLQSEMLSYKIVQPEYVLYYLHFFFLRPVHYGNQCFHLKNNNNKSAFVLFTHVIFFDWQLVRFSLKITLIGT